MTVEKVEEQWTPTTIQSTFAFRSLPSIPKSDGISIGLPLLNLGWTFTLLLTPEQPHKKGSKKPTKKRVCNWIPAGFSFRQHGSAARWGNASINAQLSLGEESTFFDSTPLSTMNFVLADTPSLELPLTSTTLRTISSELPHPNRVRLTVTISACPFPGGLFGACLGPVNEIQVQAQFVRESGDRFLSRSLTTGRLFDVRFLTFSTRATSGNTGEPLPTYASLTVLEEHVNISSSILGEGLSNALSALDDTSAKRVEEILCPKDYEYELDSDFEDEDETPSVPCNLGCQRDPTALEGRQLDSATERSSSPLSAFELEGVSDRGSAHCQLEHTSSAKEPTSDYERTVWVKFAAHRTWHAFLWYCYTGNLEFSKLKSQVEPGGRLLRVTPLEGGPPTCSPKLMYRLADLVGDNDLKAKALVAIKERMTEANVLDEAFSVFTSKYPNVREVQLDVLMEHCGSPKVKEAFLGAMEKYSSMLHAKPVLSAFYDNLVA